MAENNPLLSDAKKYDNHLNDINEYVNWIADKIITKPVGDLDTKLKDMRKNASEWTSNIYPAIISTSKNIKRHSKLVNDGFNELTTIAPKVVATSDVTKRNILLEAYIDPLHTFFKDLHNDVEALKTSTTAFDTKMKAGKTEAENLSRDTDTNAILLQNKMRQMQMDADRNRALSMHGHENVVPQSMSDEYNAWNSARPLFKKINEHMQQVAPAAANVSEICTKMANAITILNNWSINITNSIESLKIIQEVHNAWKDIEEAVETTVH